MQKRFLALYPECPSSEGVLASKKKPRRALTRKAVGNFHFGSPSHALALGRTGLWSQAGLANWGCHVSAIAQGGVQVQRATVPRPSVGGSAAPLCQPWLERRHSASYRPTLVTAGLEPPGCQRPSLLWVELQTSISGKPRKNRQPHPTFFLLWLYSRIPPAPRPQMCCF